MRISRASILLEVIRVDLPEGDCSGSGDADVVFDHEFGTPGAIKKRGPFFLSFFIDKNENPD